MKKKRIVYYYNTETCEYERGGLSLRHIGNTILSHLPTITIIVILSVVSYNSYFYQLKDTDLVTQNQLLQTEVSQLDSSLSKLEGFIDHLHHRETDLYRSMLGMDPIPENIWKGGQGGGDTYFSASQSVFNKMVDRLELLQYQINLLKESYSEIRDVAITKQDQMKYFPSVVPVRGKLVSGFGSRTHPIAGGTHFHTGLDFACPLGTPIYATADGTIYTPNGHNSGYGICIDIDHGNGFQTKYAHLSKMLVSPGQKVKRFQVIGYSGSTGTSTGPHLHYEVIRQGIKVDPIDYFYSDISPEEYKQLYLESTAVETVTMD